MTTDELKIIKKAIFDVLVDSDKTSEIMSKIIDKI